VETADDHLPDERRVGQTPRVGIFGRQFGRPSGLIGSVVGKLMARGNAPFNTALVDRLHELYPDRTRIVEVGCGPGIGLSALLYSYPSAHILGIDLSPQMVAQSRARTVQAIRGGRLELRQGDVRDVIEPADLMLAVHVVYFWHDPDTVLRHIRALLTGGGVLALGYRCRQDMPPPARRDFPREGHRLYDSEKDVSALLSAADFHEVQNHLITRNNNTLGWLTTGRSR
jgi:SAM-dependent methyltransferase